MVAAEAERDRPAVGTYGDGWSWMASATKQELYEEAKRRGIRGRSSMTKAQLQAALAKETPS